MRLGTVAHTTAKRQNGYAKCEMGGVVGRLTRIDGDPKCPWAIDDNDVLHPGETVEVKDTNDEWVRRIVDREHSGVYHFEPASPPFEVGAQVRRPVGGR